MSFGVFCCKLCGRSYEAHLVSSIDVCPSCGGRDWKYLTIERGIR